VKVSETLLRRAVELYNKYRAPEAIARVLEVRDDRILVVFEGTFCNTCGVNHWVEDLKYVLEDLGVEAELLEVQDSELRGDSRVGVFRILGLLRGENS